MIKCKHCKKPAVTKCLTCNLLFCRTHSLVHESENNAAHKTCEYLNYTSLHLKLNKRLSQVNRALMLLKRQTESIQQQISEEFRRILSSLLSKKIAYLDLLQRTSFSPEEKNQTERILETKLIISIIPSSNPIEFYKNFKIKEKLKFKYKEAEESFLTQDFYRNSIDAHKSAVSQIVLSSDLKNFLTSSLDSSIKYWKLRSCRLLYTFETPQIVSFFLTKNDSKIVLATRSGSVIIYNLMFKELEIEFQVHSSLVSSFCLDRSNRFLLIGSENEVKVWDFKNRLEQKSHTEESKINTICFNRNSKFVMLGCSNSNLIVLRRNLNKKQCLLGHNSGICIVKDLKNKRLIASASEDGVIIIWNITEMKKIIELNGHRNAILDLKFNKNNHLCISTSKDGYVRFWVTKSGMTSIIKHDSITSSLELNWSLNLLIFGNQEGLITFQKFNR